MTASIGVDLVHIPRMREMLADQTVLNRLFLPQELKNKDPAHLAGMMAAKEAVFKALQCPPAWHDVSIRTSCSGKPSAVISRTRLKAGRVDLSISHDGDYAVAVVVVHPAGKRQ